jgi:hypothetical protein
MKRHALDPVSLLGGVALGGLGLAMFTRALTITTIRAGWIWPTVALIGGAALLLRTRETDECRSEDAAEDSTQDFEDEVVPTAEEEIVPPAEA